MTTHKDPILISILNSALSGNLFGYTSKSTPWGSPDTPPLVLPTDKEVMDEILFTKRIDSNQVRILIDKIEWDQESIYQVGDVVITDEHILYYRESVGNSVISPTHTSGIIDDWKFITILTQEEQFYFSTSDFIPINWDNEYLFWTDLPKRIRINFQIISDEDGKFPLEFSYRIAGIYVNPFNRNPQNDERLNLNFTQYGKLLCIDTFEPIVRTPEGIHVHSFDVILP